MTMDSHTDELHALLAAARRLLMAREDQMLTCVEWEDLQHAVDSCGPQPPEAIPPQPDEGTDQETGDAT